MDFAASVLSIGALWEALRGTWGSASLTWEVLSYQALTAARLREVESSGEDHTARGREQSPGQEVERNTEIPHPGTTQAGAGDCPVRGDLQFLEDIVPSLVS